jgi:hypothetical protein
MQQDSSARPPDERTGDETTYEASESSQEEFEALLRKYDGDFQKAVDAQRRGEKPRSDNPASSSW